MAKPGRPYMVAADIGRAAGIVSTSKKKEDVLWPHGIQCADNTFVWPAKLTWVSLLRALLYALKTHCVPVEQGQWSPADLALVRAALGVWAVGFSDSLLRDLLSLAVILANVCLGDDCDDSCHLCSYMAAHARFCQALRAVHPVVHSMEAALAYIASTGHGVAGATDASAATKEKLGYEPGQTKWAAAGEASAAARGQSSVRKFMPDIHAWFMENWRDEKKRGKWEAVVAALPQVKDANVDSLRTVYGRWKREQEKEEKEEKKEQ
ncbi:hypothetical protein CHLRE_10g437700v5 [Chlamydomonas reinhardtii]|nr:uncharacterized protein CHLRE_10g437700v5 [Chlamydomonas reinhardtii]PNW77464.1 hypothetical protein CHLRE_10g437700v5 [Chlamydomonas reinhardtii]